MNIVLPLIALVVGFLAVYRYAPAMPPGWGDFVAIAILAGFDALVGGVRARLEQRFDEGVFVSGFFANMMVAILLAYFGDKLGVDLYLAVVVALGIRVFNNIGRIRGLIMTRRIEDRNANAAQPSP
jgi:small basic protein